MFIFEKKLLVIFFSDIDINPVDDDKRPFSLRHVSEESQRVSCHFCFEIFKESYSLFSQMLQRLWVGRSNMEYNNNSELTPTHNIGYIVLNVRRDL